MDRSFLSQAEVIAASRQFVCVRLTTYEDKKEAELLKSIFVGRSGDVENTTFTILPPDGKQPLVRPGRSARHCFGSAAQMADAMNRIAKQYEGRKADADPPLPKVPNVRLALDVAACENQPLAVLCARDAGALRQLEGRVRTLAWSDDLLGQAVYAVTDDFDQLKSIEGVPAAGGLLVIQPDRYGLKGKVLGHAAADAASAELARVLKTAISEHRPFEKTFENHIREGHRVGVFWETQIPVTDWMEKRAREQKGVPPPPPLPPRPR
jgi:hypothetical protein